jgi:NAD(P)-dependent dehydrogenase (short-subunit alcohol dehydrogenase family)
MTKVRDFRDVLEVNTVSQFLVLQGLARNLNRGASCVVVGSATSTYFQPGNMVYAVSKAALDRMVLSFAGELAPLGIRVNAVVPGPVTTKMLERMDSESLNRMMDDAFRKSPTDPADIAKVIAFLLSAESEAMVGAVVKLDGGLA